MVRGLFLGILLLVLVNVDVEGGGESEFFAYVVKELSRAYGISPEDLEVEIVRYPRFGDSLSGLKWSVEFNKERIKLGYNTLWLVFRGSGNKIVKKFPVSVRVSGWFDVVVAVKDIRAGSLLERDDFEVKKLKFSRGAVDFFRVSDISLIDGNVARRFIRAGEVIRPRMIKERPLFRRGERVWVRIVSSGIEVTTRGKAKEDGYLGKDVRVSCDPADRIFVGRVLDSLTVLVKLN